MGVGFQICQEVRKPHPLPIVYFVRVGPRFTVELTTKNVVEFVFGQTTLGVRGPVDEAKNLFGFGAEAELLP